MTSSRALGRPRGYFFVGVYCPKAEVNVGTLWRSALQLGAMGIFTIGRRYKKQPSDTQNASLHIPLYNYADMDEFKMHRPVGAVLVGIEMGGRSLSGYVHPQNAIYLLGAEDNGLPKIVADHCNHIVSLDSVGPNSFNVAVAGSIVMYHRVFGI